MMNMQQIVVPVDFNEHTDTLAEFALEFANKTSAKVTFVHVMKQITDYLDFNQQAIQQLEHSFFAHAQSKMAAFLEKIRSSGQDCAGEVVAGQAVDAIIAFAKTKNADLIIISTHGAQGMEKVLLGSVADRVIKGAHCPTLVFNPFKGERGYAVCGGEPMNSCIQAV